MSFWADKILQQATPPPAPVQQPSTVAPGTWWQQGTQHQRPVEQYPQQQPQPVQQQPQSYAPVTAQVLSAVDNCPRCNSPEYAEITVDTTYGGARPELIAQGGKVKQCFDCRYPWPNASGEIIKGHGTPVKATSTSTKNVRQVGNPQMGSATLGTLFDGAVLITPS